MNTRFVEAVRTSSMLQAAEPPRKAHKEDLAYDTAIMLQVQVVLILALLAITIYDKIVKVKNQ